MQITPAKDVSIDDLTQWNYTDVNYACDAHLPERVESPLSSGMSFLLKFPAILLTREKKEKTSLTITRSSRKVKDGRNFLIGLRCSHKFMWMKGTDSETYTEYVPVCFRVITVLLPVGWRHTLSFYISIQYWMSTTLRSSWFYCRNSWKHMVLISRRDDATSTVYPFIHWIVASRKSERMAGCNFGFYFITHFFT